MTKKYVTKRRSVRDGISIEQIRRAVLTHFSEDRLEEDFFKLVVDIVDRAVIYGDTTEDNIDDYVSSALDDGIIYTVDQWTMMAHYQSPEKADYNNAYDLFYNDVYTIVENLISDRFTGDSKSKKKRIH